MVLLTLGVVSGPVVILSKAGGSHQVTNDNTYFGILVCMCSLFAAPMELIIVLAIGSSNR